MHVPIDVFSRDWDEMVQKKAWGVLPGFDPPYIGVTGNSRADGRAEIKSVEVHGPADLAGIIPGDVVVGLDDKPVTTFQDLEEAIRGYSPGDLIVLKVRRGSSTLRIPVTVGSRKSRESR